MTGPFIYIGTSTIREGKLDECRSMLREITELVERHEPRVIAFNCYVEEESRTAVCVQVHPDATSMDHHMQVIGEHLTTAYGVLEATVSEQLYGPGGERMVDEFRKWAPDATFTVIPHHEVGLTRTATA